MKEIMFHINFDNMSILSKFFKFIYYLKSFTLNLNVNKKDNYIRKLFSRHSLKNEVEKL